MELAYPSDLRLYKEQQSSAHLHLEVLKGLMDSFEVVYKPIVSIEHHPNSPQDPQLPCSDCLCHPTPVPAAVKS